MRSLSIARIRPTTRPHPIRLLAADAFPKAEDAWVDDGRWMDDVRQFLVGWLAGLVFFGTFLA